MKVQWQVNRIAWGSDMVSIAERSTSKTFSEGLPVELISTARKDFMTCYGTEMLPEVVARNTENYDYCPVLEKRNDGSDRITGLVFLEPYQHSMVPCAPVLEHLQPLNETMLIGADASIVSFILQADRHRCRLVVSGAEISGLVTLSDLQKLPVRAALFAIITQLEITMGEVLARKFPKEESWLSLLSEGRRQKLSEEISKSLREDTFVNSLLFTQFPDKIKLLAKSQRPPFNKTMFENELELVQRLRDSLAHANNYAETTADALKTCMVARLIDKWLAEFSSW